MKICEVEIQADGRKATFFYTAEDRVDFRELIKIYATEFKVKVEMKQIGARQEAAKVGGIGSCGRELCCSSWLNEFKSVTTAMARYQNLSINQTKLSGQCGRLKCCLNYELDTYLDALQHFPDHAEVLQTAKGNAQLIKKDIFKNLMWYTLPDSNKQYPLSIDTVKKIKSLNSKGIFPEELETEDVASTSKAKEPEPQFVDVVGQISLRSLERNAQKRRGTRDKGQGTREKPAQTRVSGGEGFNTKGVGSREKREGLPARRESGPNDRGDNKGPKPQGKQIKLNRNDQGNRRDPA